MHNNNNNNYETFYYSTGDYRCQILCLSYASIYSFIDEIQNELKEKQIKNARILIDQLLITGNNKNRFLSVDFNNGKLSFSTASNVLGDSIYRQFTASYLKKDNEYLKNSILSSNQKKLIERGCII